MPIYWDEKEIAILMDNFMKYEHNILSRKKAIQQTSETLRLLAEARGLNVDDIFRNENGIDMQMSKLEDLYLQKNPRLRQPPKLFVEIYNLYFESRKKFNNLLQSAYIQSSSKNKEKVLSEWLSKKKLGIKIETIIKSLGQLDVLLNKEKILTGKVINIEDYKKIEDLITKLKNGNLIKIASPKKRNLYLTALSYLKKFLLDNLEHEKLPIINDSHIITKSDVVGSANLSADDACLKENIVKFLKAKKGVNKSDLIAHFKKKNVSARQINSIIENSAIVIVLGKCYLEDDIEEFDDMATVLLDVLNRQFLSNGDYTSINQLYLEAHSKLDDFFFYNNAFESKAEIYDLAEYLFKNKKYKGNSFIFLNGIHIWKKEPNYPKDFSGLLVKYGREHNNIFSRDEAINYFAILGSATPVQTFSYILFNTGSNLFLQYDENKFILTEAMNCSENFLLSVKTQIDNLMDGSDYVSFGDIDEYFYKTLPLVPTNIYWSALLITDILRLFDIGYFTLEAGKDNDKKTVPAAIVKTHSAFKSFPDILWNEIAKQYSLPKEFLASEFRQFLFDEGFIRETQKRNAIYKTVDGDIRFYWNTDNSKVVVN